MSIPVTFLSESSFSVAVDCCAAFPPGVRVQADCGADGLRYGTSAGCSGTTVTLAMDSGQTLTGNLAGVLHGNDVPLSLLSPPGCYYRDARWTAKTVTGAADRYALLSPNRMTLDVGGTLLCLMAQQALDLSRTATWDATTPTDFTLAANRAGRDFYIYACVVSGALKLVVSASATFPVGYTTATARQIGGFHCLCADAGTIAGHPLSGYLAGDILPASVWDLKFRPANDPEGMVYVAGIGRWVDIYLASVSGERLVSINGGTVADGASSPGFSWYEFSEWFGRIGKRLLTQNEFMAASFGSNQGTSISGSADAVTTGCHLDTGGRRMVSNVGCEDTCGFMCQWSADAGGGVGTASFKVQYVATDTTEQGQSYMEPCRAGLGGTWVDGVKCGSRFSYWNNSPITRPANCGARGISDAINAI